MPDGAVVESKKLVSRFAACRLCRFSGMHVRLALSRSFSWFRSRVIDPNLVPSHKHRRSEAMASISEPIFIQSDNWVCPLREDEISHAAGVVFADYVDVTSQVLAGLSVQATFRLKLRVKYRLVFIIVRPIVDVPGRNRLVDVQNARLGPQDELEDLLAIGDVDRNILDLPLLTASSEGSWLYLGGKFGREFKGHA